MFVVCDDGMCSCPHDWSIGPLKHWVYRNLRMVVVNRRIYWWRSAYYGVGWVMLCVDYLVFEHWCSCWFGRVDDVVWARLGFVDGCSTSVPLGDGRWKWS